MCDNACVYSFNLTLLSLYYIRTIQFGAMHILSFPQYLKLIVPPVQGLEHAFLAAANKGDVPRMKDLLDQGCPVDAQGGVSTAVVSFHCS